MDDTSSAQLHVVVGAGAVGSAVVAELVHAGHRVRVVTRSGSGPELAGVERVAADAGDDARLTQLSTGAAALYNCANPRYHRWELDWPPIANALLSAAERTGAVLATVANLYPYGPVDGPMTEQAPLAATFTNGRVRAQMWRDALAAHTAGRARVTEVRASDYVGPHSQGQFAERAVPKLVRGKAVGVLGRPDVAHTYSYPGDVARLLTVAASDPRAWGQAWHVPSNPPTTAAKAASTFSNSAPTPMPAPITEAPSPGPTSEPSTTYIERVFEITRMWLSACLRCSVHDSLGGLRQRTLRKGPDCRGNWCARYRLRPSVPRWL